MTLPTTLGSPATPEPPTVGPAATPAGPAATPAAPPAGSAARGPLLMLAGILLVALNLRAAVTALGAVLDEASSALAFSGAIAGLVTTLPTIAFAVFGAVAPWLVRRFAAPRVLLLATIALTAGQLLRAVTDSALLFVLASALALAGIAVGNILLPMLVKQYFPHRAGLVTSAYTVSLTIGATAAAAATVPIATAAGSWRVGIGFWALLAAVGILPWAWLALRSRRERRRATVVVEPAPGPRVRPARTGLGWAMALYFGTQSFGGFALMGWLAQLYRDAGYSPRNAGLLLAGVTALGIPIALALPVVAARLATLRPLVLGLSAVSVLAYVGLAVAPYEGALIWTVLLAIGQGAFPLILLTIGLRARTPQGTVALSGFAQSTGYLVAIAGPFLVGLAYSVTGGWHVPLGLLLVALAGQTLAGLAIARPRFIEDE